MVLKQPFIMVYTISFGLRHNRSNVENIYYYQARKLVSNLHLCSEVIHSFIPFIQTCVSIHIFAAGSYSSTCLFFLPIIFSFILGRSSPSSQSYPTLSSCPRWGDGCPLPIPPQDLLQKLKSFLLLLSVANKLL